MTAESFFLGGKGSKAHIYLWIEQLSSSTQPGHPAVDRRNKYRLHPWYRSVS